MATTRSQRMAREAWARAGAQHDVIHYHQLRAIGFTHSAIRHRRNTGRLFELWPLVYSVGRPDPGRLGWWKAATLAAGPESALAGESGAALRGLRKQRRLWPIEIAVPSSKQLSLRGIRTVRCRDLEQHVEAFRGIPVCSTPLLIVQLAAQLGDGAVEAAMNEADKLDLIDPEALRESIEGLSGRPGVARARRILDRYGLQLPDSELERLFRPIARRAGLGEFLMGEEVNGFEVDFFFPHLNYVIETDGLRYHRTAITQTRDLVRDQTHDAAGTWNSRFSHAQIKYDPAWVETVCRDKLRQIESVVISRSR